MTFIRGTYMDKIIKLTPNCKDYIWGGNKLAEQYGKHSDTEKIAETWEISGHPDGPTYIASGADAGVSMLEYVQRHKEVLGTKGEKYESFPILCKFIDAAKTLSIQVHPNDAYARARGMSRGKTEMWYIVSCEEGAYIYFGTNREVTREELAKRIKNNTLPEILNKVHVQEGDCFLVEAGTLHAIGAGIVIYEVQQSVNCTYRVYDYDRRDAAGKPRELHIEDALEVARLIPNGQDTTRRTLREDKELLSACKHFTVYKYTCSTECVIDNCRDSFQTLTVVSGTAILSLDDMQVKAEQGDSYVVAANAGDIHVTGDAIIITSNL